MDLLTYFMPVLAVGKGKFGFV